MTKHNTNTQNYHTNYSNYIRIIEVDGIAYKITGHNTINIICNCQITSISNFNNNNEENIITNTKLAINNKQNKQFSVVTTAMQGAGEDSDIISNTTHINHNNDI